MPDNLMSISRQSSTVELRHRQLLEAEGRANDDDVDDGPLKQAYHEAQSRFIAAPATSLRDVFLKLEEISKHEDLAATLKDEPGLLWARVVSSLLLDLRGLSTSAVDPSSCDLAAIRSAADVQVNEIARLHIRIANGIDLLKEVADRIFVERPADGCKLQYLAETLDDAAAAAVSAKEALEDVLTPINPRKVQHA